LLPLPWLIGVVDDHHTAEDTFLALGSAFSTALGNRTGLVRFGSAYCPLDEALSRAVIDLSNRPFFVGEFGFRDAKIGSLTTQMIHHGLQSWSQAAGVTLHVDVLRGDNDHHRAESAFKALAVAAKIAVGRVEGRAGEVISTKGVL
jgi:imidazoleglycerol-phosphate dehydratase